MKDAEVSTTYESRWFAAYVAAATQTILEDLSVAVPNYQFEKRRRDLEKKAKKAEKRQKRLQNPTGSDSDADSDSDSPETQEPSSETGAAENTVGTEVPAAPAPVAEVPPVRRLARLKI